MAAGTVTAATSSLASELLLNKIMNGQVKTSTGKSITAAGRAISSRLGGEAYKARSAEANMAYGEGLASSAQNEVSSIKDQLLKTKQNLLDVMNKDAATSADFKGVGTAAAQMFKTVGSIIASANYNGKTLFGAGTAIKGNGVTITTPDVVATTIIKAAKAALTTSLKSTNAADGLTALDTAINSLIEKETELSDSVKAFQNRQLLLADQGANLDNAASAQSTSDMSGSSNLLSSMLG